MKQVPTGISGLDKMLNGGLPCNRTFLVCGGPGSGKTILGVQFLYYGAVELGEPGMYVSLDEDKDQLKEDLASFGWDIDNLEKTGKFVFLDTSPIRRLPGGIKIGDTTIGKRDFDLMGVAGVMMKQAEQKNIKRVFLDPISALTFQYPSEPERRTATLDFLQILARLKTTNLVSTELRSLSLHRDILTEEFLTQGVIVLHSWRNQLAVHGGIQVEKMRGIAHDNQIRPYKITKKGIQVFPEEQPLLDIDTAVSSEIHA
jgi:circadian clock protein KaiC